MKLWMRKLFVAIITFVTLGLYIPPLEINPENDRAKDSENFYDDLYSSNVQLAEEKETQYTITVDPVDDHLHLLSEKAKEQLKRKLGSKILTEIESDVFETIYPKMHSVIEEVVYKQDENKVSFLEITENPSGGTGERIFNVYDHNTNSILLKFHVRRDQRPLEGHWFNFHYHVYEDRFEGHYELGEIYWDKNDPPQWLS